MVIGQHETMKLIIAPPHFAGELESILIRNFSVKENTIRCGPQTVIERLGVGLIFFILYMVLIYFILQSKIRTCFIA